MKRWTFTVVPLLFWYDLPSDAPNITLAHYSACLQTGILRF